jgi:predicted DNA-binding protein (UPF0251 family)
VETAEKALTILNDDDWRRVWIRTGRGKSTKRIPAPGIAGFLCERLEQVLNLGLGTHDPETLYRQHEADLDLLERESYFGQEKLQGKSAKRKRRRRASAPRLVPLTNKQLEAVHLVGEHKGNVSAAARAVGISRQTMNRRYDKAMKKLGRKAVKHRTKQLPTDRRGQINVADLNISDPSDFD